MQDDSKRKLCPFLSTHDNDCFCREDCALCIPTVEPPYVMCSIRLIAGQITGESNED